MSIYNTLKIIVLMLYIFHVDDLSLSSNVIGRSKLSEKKRILLQSSGSSSLYISSSQSSSNENTIQFHNSTSFSVDDRGEKCTVLKHHVDDDILKDLDLEKSLGSDLIARLQYPITKNSVNVSTLQIF